jgi:beta-galactosidase GanA
VEKHERQSIGHIANLVANHKSSPAPHAILPVDMRIPRCTLPVLLLLATLGGPNLSAQPGAGPHLEKRGSATQLIVAGKPFLILGGELHNSSSSSLAYMKPLWPQLAAMGLNTVVTPLSWELIEPIEGKYDFTPVDGLLAQAREAHERVVFLWLASWKNGMSSYAPVWVKQDTKRFSRVVVKGKEIELLSPATAATQQADARAFAALMHHIQQVDAQDHTVLMMQVENEVGVLGDSRDRSSAADRAFLSPVPAELTRYLKDHHDTLYPRLRELWDANGGKTSGAWPEIFGNSNRADEIFMAWHYARFIRAVTAAGKSAYNLPMYVNTWLAENDAEPGSFPSGGPEPWVVDIWRAAGTAIDFYAPDLYAPDFIYWCRQYHRGANPLFMPETRGGTPGAANVFYAVGEEAGFGFSPFAIEDDMAPKQDLASSYRAINSLAALLLEHQAVGDVHGFALDKQHPTADFTLNGIALHVSIDEIFGQHAQSGYGLIMATGPNEFIGAGKGFRVTAASTSGPRVGIASIDEGEFEDGKWVPGRRLNGDENDQGSFWRFDARQLHIERMKLYLQD